MRGQLQFPPCNLLLKSCEQIIKIFILLFTFKQNATLIFNREIFSLKVSTISNVITSIVIHLFSNYEIVLLFVHQLPKFFLIDTNKIHQMSEGNLRTISKYKHIIIKGQMGNHKAMIRSRKRN